MVLEFAEEFDHSCSSILSSVEEYSKLADTISKQQTDTIPQDLKTLQQQLKPDKQTIFIFHVYLSACWLKKGFVLPY